MARTIWPRQHTYDTTRVCEAQRARRKRESCTVNFEPVRTKDELDSLDLDEIIDGYRSAERGDPEPGPNRGRAYWHGWRVAMMDMGEIKIDAAHRLLVREVAPGGRVR